MERSLSTRNPREIRGYEAADRRESSVKKCHVISGVMKMTLDTRHRADRGAVAIASGYLWF
jgi:hypothetical protein